MSTFARTLPLSQMAHAEPTASASRHAAVLGATAANDTAVRWVLASHEARVRGFRNALAFRRWCRRHGVVIHTDGRMQWVRRADVDAAIERVLRGEACELRPTPRSSDTASAPVDPVASAVDAVMLGRRRA